MHSPEFDSPAYKQPNVAALASATECPPRSFDLVKALIARHFPAPRAFYASPSDPEQLNPSTSTHYCLNATVVHATAPIRRFVDVLVQRSLLATFQLRFEADESMRDERARVPIERMLASANLRSSMLRDAERDATRWCTAAILSKRPQLFSAIVVKLLRRVSSLSHTSRRSCLAHLLLIFSGRRGRGGKCEHQGTVPTLLSPA